MPERWQFWIDRGGTFTDIVGAPARRRAASRTSCCRRTPSTTATRRVAGIRASARPAAGASRSRPSRSNAVKMGTTVATNALLERKGERTRAGHHPRLSRRAAHRLPEPAAAVRPPHRAARAALQQGGRGRGARRRARRGGACRSTRAHAARDLQAAYDEGFRSHRDRLHARLPLHRSTSGARPSWRAPSASRRSRVSHEVSPLMKLVGRGDTTVVDAYLSPILRRYVDQVAAELAGVRLLFMQSNGGLTDARRFQGKDAILSGPGRRHRRRGAHRRSWPASSKIIGFDMGGTSTDVSHYAGEFERAFETQVAGVRMRAPMMSIHTVAAGGGSILHFDGARYRVGPDRAGANPGPGVLPARRAARRDRRNVMLGKIQPAYFPARVRRRRRRAARRRGGQRRSSPSWPPRSARDGRRARPSRWPRASSQIAVGNMANAIKQISVQRGYDVTDYTLQLLRRRRRPARLPGRRRARHDARLHPSARRRAVGLRHGAGRPDRDARAGGRAAARRATVLALRATRWTQLAGAARDELRAPGRAARRVSHCVERVHLRYEGTDTALVVPLRHDRRACARRSRRPTASASPS